MSATQSNTVAGPKRLVRNAVLLLAALGAGYFLYGEAFPRTSPQSAERPVPLSAKLVVYYFSTGKECSTCEQIPVYAREALGGEFAGAVASGEIVWREYDVDRPEFAHFVADYSIYTKAIVLSRRENGAQVKWKNLEKVWDLVGDRAAFEEYVRAEVREMLETPA